MTLSDSSFNCSRYSFIDPQKDFHLLYLSAYIPQESVFVIFNNKYKFNLSITLRLPIS